MALSNDEQHTLDEIERGLRDEDPVFVHTVDFDRLRLRRVMTGALVFLLGMVVLVVGEVASQAQLAVGVCVGVSGFVTMFAAAAWVFIGRRKT
jgi:multidrug efflux pump subunit AcrB